MTKRATAGEQSTAAHQSASNASCPVTPVVPAFKLPSQVTTNSRLIAAMINAIHKRSKFPHCLTKQVLERRRTPRPACERQGGQRRWPYRSATSSDRPGAAASARALILGELRAPTAARDTLRSVTAHRSCAIEGTWASVYVRFEGSLVSSELLHGGRSSLRSPRQRIKSNESPSANEWVYLDTITIIHCGGFPAQLTINQY